MSPRALWLPFGVADLDAATAFYTGAIGLSVVDSWDRDGERGTVLAAGAGAYVELVAPGTPGPAPLAVQLDDRAAVDRSFSGMDGARVLAAPSHHPRGHYGYRVRGPAGVTVLVWSERE